MRTEECVHMGAIVTALANGECVKRTPKRVWIWVLICFFCVFEPQVLNICSYPEVEDSRYKNNFNFLLFLVILADADITNTGIQYSINN